MLGLPWWIVLATTAVAAWIDLAIRRIPNLLTGPVLLLGLLYQGWQGGLWGVAEAFLASLLLGIPYVLLFVFAGGGAGDAKLMMALGAWLGLWDGILTLLTVALSGVVLALAFAMMRGRLLQVLAHLRRMVYGMTYLVIRQKQLGDIQFAAPEQQDMIKMPYGLAILTGVVVAAGLTAGGMVPWRST